MQGGGEGDVRGVVLVADFLPRITGFQTCAVVGYARRGERESLDPARATATGIKMETEKKRVLFHAIGDINPFLERVVSICITDQFYSKALGFQ